jgi:hypothetical protein
VAGGHSAGGLTLPEKRTSFDSGTSRPFAELFRPDILGTASTTATNFAKFVLFSLPWHDEADLPFPAV